jgi:hypothetical protein
MDLPIPLISMFRRIELIHPGIPEAEGLSLPGFKQGLTPFSWPEITDAWIDDLLGPHGSIPENSRFYFTERGWRSVGRNVVAAAMRVGQPYRVIAIKETDAQVVWRDKARGYEVAVQPPRKRGDAERRRITTTDAD